MASLRFTPATSGDARLHILAILVMFGAGGVFLFTQRIELLALIGVPLALRMVTSFRTAALITTCVMLVWFSRVPTTFFDLVVFSYAVYAVVALTIAAFCIRMVHGGTRLPFITNPYLWLYVTVVVSAGLNGIRNVDAIPAWMVNGTNVDYGVPWVYFRTIVLPGILLPLLAVITAVAIADRQKLATAMLPVWIFAGAMAAMVLAFVASSGVSLGTMAEAGYRSEHLKDLGFHSNELGTFLAIAYALLLGARQGLHDRRARAAAALVLAAVSAAILLTFSRGAMLAFVMVNVFYFVAGSSRRRAVFAMAVVLTWIVLPAAVLERAQFGLDTFDLNAISAGRLDNIWMPLVPDVLDHWLFGQGLHSIMWTDAQRLQQIYPVNIAHNAYLDLVLDLGVVGCAVVLAWYVFLWRAFKKGAATDPDPRFRAVFYGGYLAVVALGICALSNDRLTPTAPSCLLWVAAGVVLGREAQLRRAMAATLAAVPQRASVTSWRGIKATRPLVAHSRGEA